MASGGRGWTCALASSTRTRALHAASLPGGEPGLWVGTGEGLVRCDDRGCAPIPGFAELPIIATSASVEEPARARGAASGCDELLPKPIALDALLELLERRLALTWIRATPAPRPEATAKTAGPRVPPPPEVIARLSELVERGRIQELAQALSALEAEDPRLGPWIAEARALAEGFRIDDLQALLAAPDTGASP